MPANPIIAYPLSGGSSTPSGQTLIASQVLAATAASVTFSSIPTTYSALLITWNGGSNLSSPNGQGITLVKNGGTTGLWSIGTLNSNGTVSGYQTTANAYGIAGAADSLLMSGSGVIFGASKSTQQQFCGQSCSFSGSGANAGNYTINFGSDSNPVSSLTLGILGGVFSIGSSFSLYGIE